MTTWGAGLYWSQHARAWCGLVASLPDGRLLVRHELTWWRQTPDAAAADLVAFTKATQITLSTVVGQPELFPKAKARGETISHVFHSFGVPMVKGDDDRINGWSRFHSWLGTHRHGNVSVPSLVIHPDCRYLLRTLPSLISAKNNPDDVDESPEEYPASGLRLYLMNRPHPWQQPAPVAPGPGTWGYALRDAFQPTRGYVVGEDLVDR